MNSIVEEKCNGNDSVCIAKAIAPHAAMMKEIPLGRDEHVGLSEN